MQLNKINGNTYYISAPTNIGVFVFKDKYVLLVDTGNSPQQAARIDRLLLEQQWKTKFIFNTHHHVDHSGGDPYFTEHYPGSVILTSEEEALFLENDHLFPLYLYGAAPIKELSKLFVRPKKNIVDNRLEPGNHKINDERFEIFYLKGHTWGQIGIATKDRVCFLGDAVFSREIVNKYPFPFLLDIKEQVKTLEFLETLTYDYYILSHGGEVLSPEEFHRTVSLNIDVIDKFSQQILSLLDQPLTREGLLEELAVLNDLCFDFQEYHFSFSTVGAFLTFLFGKGLLDYYLEDGKLYYFKK